MNIVFISSRIRELEPEREVVKETLLSLGFRNVILWEDIPGRSRPPEEIFLSEVERSKIFILILWKEYSNAVFKEFERAYRKRIPILVFIKKLRGDWGEKRDVDLQEFIVALTSYGYSWKEFRELRELRLILTEAMMATLFEHLETPFLSHSPRDLYKLGDKIASSATNRVVLLARSLILVTGPRPFVTGSRSYSPISPIDYVDYEKSHYDYLENLVQKAKKGEIRFSCSYIIPNIKKKLTDYPQIKEFVKERITYLFNCNSKTVPTSRFSILTPIPEWNPHFTFIVGDNQFAIWFTDPQDPEIYACISSEDKTIATTLVRIFEGICKEKPLNTILEEVQLL